MDKRKPVATGDVVAIVCPSASLGGTFVVLAIHDDYISVRRFHDGCIVRISRDWIVKREFIEEDGA